MNEVFEIKGIECFEKNGIAYLKLEPIARGLGFTQTKNGVEYVKWERVTKYLSELNSPLVGKDGFIPESIFYRLAMKANNEVANNFQNKIANEVLPSIRKHGAYATPETIENIISNPDFGIKLLNTLKEEREKNKVLTDKVEQDKPKVIFAEAVTSSKTSILVGELAKILRQNGVNIGEKRLFIDLREKGYLCKRKGSDWNMPTQRSMEQGLFEIKESTHLDGNGCNVTKKTPKVTGKGQQYFINKYLALR